MNLLTAECTDCLTTVDFTDKNSLIACVVTMGVAAIVRWFEKRKDRKNK